MKMDEPNWFNRETKGAWWHGAMIRLLKMGPMPKHVAFIMDGNRRYARKNAFSTVIEGHMKGFERLADVLNWCDKLDVSEVTVYAFSLENFKRNKHEVSQLMVLFEEKLKQLLNEREKLIDKGLMIRFPGDLSYLPSKLQKLVAKIELLTRNNKTAVVNVCIAYTAQDEIKRAFNTIKHGIQKGLLDENDISERVISKCLDTRRSSDPDLLIRTSGETRLSDFLLWQCSNCCIYFDNTLWPDFGFWNLCKAIYAYQRNLAKIKQMKEELVSEDTEDSDRLADFYDWVESKHLESLKARSIICVK